MSSAEHENPYLRDASEFLRPALAIIARDKPGIDLSELVLFCALGIERILKGLLWRINPIYVLSDTSFQNSAPIVYGKAMQPSTSKGNREVSVAPNSEVVSFRTAVLRASLFSSAVAKHQGTLFKLSNFRDIVAHRDLNDLRSGKAGKPWPLLLGDIFPLLQDFEAEKLIRIVDISEGKQDKLRKVSIKHTEEVSVRLQKRLQLHHEIWESRTPAEKEVISKSLRPKCWPQQWDKDVVCPACGNKAYVRYEVDFDVEDGDEVIGGMLAQYLACPWCDLLIEDYQELQNLNIPLFQ